ncbi:hypothetical protein DQ04_04481030 [Trypanosoma grayi]|uniref:hypothetical protein n=1 Tax=Trypanosoma grayi TaxID=71804 RepID=UPI0004F3FD08|nr:hypothetical protein DQ04_04481030 [Trypanosoma grayi]KEG09893.1 hypothetical protein DQ04_04481030 [Trypanosoma grayi]
MQRCGTNGTASPAPREAAHANDIFRRMSYYHLRRLRAFYAHYAPPTVPQCCMHLQQYSGREEATLEALRRVHGSEPVHLGSAGAGHGSW